MSQPDRQGQAQSYVTGAGQKVRDFVQSDEVKQVTDKLKTRWVNLSGRNKIIIVCVGVLCLSLLWRLVSGGEQLYTPDELFTLIEKDSKAAEGQLASKWITVTGTVLDVEYPRKQGFHYEGARIVSDFWLPMCLNDKDSSISVLSSRSKTFTVQVVYGGSKSGGVETESVLRGDTITFKGKVEVVSTKAVGLNQGKIVSLRHR